jgi:predicted acylesterase/phospholipase RssA
MDDDNNNGWDDFLSEDEIKETLLPSLHDFKIATTLVLPSGGVKGVYLLGAIQYLYEKIGLQHIKSYYGTSIGAIISGLLIIGYNPLELLVYICVHKIINCLAATFHITNIVTDKKFLDAKLFNELLQTIIKNKIGYIPTLAQLYDTYKKKLCIVTIARNKPTEPLYISHETHPTLPLDIALQMSSSIPFIFGYTVYDSIEYIDGGLIDPFPIVYASTYEKNVFGISLHRNISTSENLFQDIISVLYIPILYIEKINTQQLVRGTYIEIKTNEEFVTKRNGELISMFTSGYQQCKQLLQLNIQKSKKKME